MTRTSSETRIPSQASGELELTVVLPCLNEALTVATCVGKALASMRANGVDGEVLVADNGSTDGSVELARAAGARVVAVSEKGYGAALRGGIEAARGRWVLMADADDSYALDDITAFLQQLRAGADMVVGNRFMGGIAPGAMPALHRWVGNPVLSRIARTFFRVPVRDFHCGMRAFRRDLALEAGLRCSGMEFASEIIVKFALAGHDVREVPTTLQPDGRDRPPHLRSWRDGWRHLRFLLLFSPRWLFIQPGLVLALLGGLLSLRLAFGPLTVGGAVLSLQSMLLACAATVVGVQAALFGVLAHAHARARGLLPRSQANRTDHPNALEHGALLGVLLILGGGVGTVLAITRWAQAGFGELEPTASMQGAIPAATAAVLGAQLLMSSFFLGLLRLDTQEPAAPAAPPEALSLAPGSPQALSPTSQALRTREDGHDPA